MHGVVADLLVFGAEVAVINAVAVPRYERGLVEERHAEYVVELVGVRRAHPERRLGSLRPVLEDEHAGGIGPLGRLVACRVRYARHIQRVEKKTANTSRRKQRKNSKNVTRVLVKLKGCIPR